MFVQRNKAGICGELVLSQAKLLQLTFLSQQFAHFNIEKLSPTYILNREKKLSILEAFYSDFVVTFKIYVSKFIVPELHIFILRFFNT